MNTALITGATSGIGAAFARLLASTGHNLVLVARDAKRLEATASQLSADNGVDVAAVSADLITAEGCEEVAGHARECDLLINNAGLALGKGFAYTSIEEEERLLDLNVRAVLRLTHAALPAMRQRGQGGIVNVSSVAGFGPTMPGSTYNASKAWVTNFSQSLAPLARREGVSVMALCPGFVRTEFHDRASIDVSDIPKWMMLDADFVAETAMRDLLRGKMVSVPSLTYKLLVSGIRHLPTGLVQRITLRMESVSRRGRNR
ncbi:MAG TPA: SDR family oxidoreductase [Stackebrandtia sp.]|jgi:short-subunit dehydrogenase|uniref:SDR family NAD(P)-dependent oxidoreductase n=1 Tax=Stackebrandtia sp. TaxID=2023065 RepID=UPI002D3F7FA9|nr:SDR family oxidoreductase [Stackebrandtia sp.]HZE38019.1 SDR family oxidoreductase [Stackebrandtia sp.]